MFENNLYGRRLRESRKRAGLSQVTLGIRAGFDEFSASARMSQYETGKHFPDLATARRLAIALDAPLAYFFCPEEELARHILLFHQLSPQQRSIASQAITDILHQQPGQ